MCSPMMAIGAIMSVASTAMQIKAQNDQIDAQNKRASQRQEAAEKDLAFQQSQELMQQEQSISRAAQKKEEIQREAIRERARARVLSGESGLAGSTVERQFITQQIQEGQSVGNVMENLQRQMTQQGYQSIGREAQTQSQINQLESQKRTGTSGLSRGLQIGASGLSGYQSGARFDAATN